MDPRGRAAVRGWRSIASEAMRRLNGDELIEVEIEDGLQRLPGGGVAQGLGQRFQPLRVLVLQGDEFGHRHMPSLRPGRAGRRGFGI